VNTTPRVPPEWSPEQLGALIRDVPDFPSPGIMFKDISPLLAHARAFSAATAAMARAFEGERPTHVAAIESRGFLLAGPIAERLGAGLIPLRKAGRLPRATRRVEYALEYGRDALEVHQDACDAAARVLIVDDVLATGGTARAACELIATLGATVIGCTFLLGIAELGGLARLAPYSGRVLIAY
jgi:adenine phosphoribosyltransferase